MESSCDETAAAVVEDGTRLLATSLVSSAAIQAQYGGVVPEVAAREHAMAILPVVDWVLKEAGLDLADIDAVAVTQGPGLLGSLLVGVTFAKTLGASLHVPVIGVHHLEAHLYANALMAPIEFPALALLVSGGHTSLFYWQGHRDLRLLGETQDDAAGEAFDKAARILHMTYPGGPQIERLARQARKKSFKLPVADMHGRLDFSFSGVKTATAALYREHPDEPEEVAYALQEAVVRALVQTVKRALARYPVGDLYLAGGVTANEAIREAFLHLGAELGIRIHIPPVSYCTDNAAMVASLGYYQWQAGETMGAFEGPKVLFPLGQREGE
ncbi:tRNA (adenosine(37)-N6)-threonylcarbamoyltransferase complex transferase subunit TsaD [Sulfobacillus thermotolerans]|uniref:tRNA (adenosine(37)-N6)-threonylcarbamoyltransferase complex transferase subunit TsaD n=1 Tax=Sulfobacillus thermotolerans TaxID=338644 RepID=UPI003369A8BE